MVLSEANAERLANALCRMRGAALKLGQMLVHFALMEDSASSFPVLELVPTDVNFSHRSCYSSSRV